MQGKKAIKVMLFIYKVPVTFHLFKKTLSFMSWILSVLHPTCTETLVFCTIPHVLEVPCLAFLLSYITPAL